jgi:uncharacterized membrane protein YhhN
LRIPLQKTIALFWLLVLADLAGIAFKVGWVHFICKPLLMPMLIFHLFRSAPGTDRKYIIGGLTLSWLGDIFLLFESSQSIFFIVGLCSFLLAHVAYILYFRNTQSAAPSLLAQYPLIILLVAAYSLGLFFFLLPNLGDLQIPVLVYAMVIGCMLLGSIHIFWKVKNPANGYFLGGAGLFVLSDSILALNKFYTPLPLAGVWIMLTYCAAQFFIVKGATARKPEA